MIVKVAAGRRDKTSSFEDLGEYITAGMEAESVDITRVSFEHLTRYVAQDSVLNALGSEIEKTIAIEMHKISTLKTAGREMWGVARENPHTKDPVLHYILSWPEQERPTVDSIMSAAKHTLKSLGLAEHQYIIAIHANTDNIHCHIEANRIHPTTFKAQPIEWMYKTLHKASREAEIEHGWLHDNGLYEVVLVNGNKHIVENKSWDDTEMSASRTKKGATIEAWTGDQSFETWCKGEPTIALKKLIKSGEYADWQAIHRVLARYGVELRDAGGGGWKVFDVASERAGEKSAVVKASQVFRFMKRAEMEARIGLFSPALPEIEKPAKTYKRDPEKRIDRRLYRKELRDALRNEYLAHSKEVRTQMVAAKAHRKALFAGDEHERIDAIRELRRQRARAIRSDPGLTKAERESALAINIMLAVQAREDLRVTIAKERAEVVAMMPVLPPWRTWVEIKAAEGNEAAISALRGIVYRERAQEKATGFVIDPETGELIPKEKPVVEPENAILPGKPTDSDPSIRCASEAVTWRVTKTGTVNFIFQSGKQAFVDEGNKLTFGGRKDVTDEALLLTLKHAREKWGKEFSLAGGDRVFQMRVLRLAAQLNMVVTDPSLRQVQQQIERLGEPVPVRSRKAEQAITTRNTESFYIDKEQHNERPDYNRISTERVRPGQRAAALYQSDLEKAVQNSPPRSIASLRNLSSVGMVLHERSAQVLLRPNASDRVGQKRAADSEMRRSRASDSRAHGHGELGAEKRMSAGNVAEQPTAASYASVVAHATADKPDVPVRRINAGDDRTYTGKVVAANGLYIIQDVGPAGLVVHQRKDLDGAAVVGSQTTIKYVRGRAEVLVKRSRSR